MAKQKSKVKRKYVTISLPEEHAEFLMDYCPNKEKIERATWISNLVMKEIKRIKEASNEPLENCRSGNP